jgi:hypothetical protein
LIARSDIAGIEIATNLHDFVTEGCLFEVLNNVIYLFFVGGRSPAMVDNFYALRV